MVEEIQKNKLENLKTRPKKLPKIIAWDKVSAVLLAVLLVITIVQSFQISTLSRSGLSGGVTGKVTSGTSGESAGANLEQILAEITPTGTPDYGREAEVSYDNVEQSLRVLMGYQQSILLSGSDMQRYIKIATTRGTACEYCCGIGDAGFGTSTGEIACGCSHNLAFGGLTKFLVKNTEYSDEQIIQEIQKWKILFFPKDSITAELQKRGISPESYGLPSMVGGC